MASPAHADERRGFHKINMKISDSIKTAGKEQVYHVIFSTYKRKEILLNRDIKREVSIWIKETCKQYNIKYYIYNILTDHVHLLLQKKKNQLLPQILQLIKGTTTYNFFQKYPDFALDLKRKRLWTHGYCAVEIKDKRQYTNTANYIKNNRDRYKDEIKFLGKAPGFMPVGDL